jgi:hypothetical protein
MPKMLSLGLGVDDEMPTEKHDALCEWVHDNASAVCDLLAGQMAQAVRRSGHGVADDCEHLSVGSVDWEVVLTNDRHFEIGFVDIAIRTRSGFDGRDCNYCDIFAEVKPEIRSLGALLRQLQLYRNHAKRASISGPWVLGVVSPDTRHRERIESQGFFFISPVDIT